MNKIKIYLLVIILLFVASCANLGDKAIELGNGYAYRVDGDQRWIRPDNIMKDGIYPNVLNYAADSLFIVVIQQPNLKGYERQLALELRYRYETVLSKEAPKNDINYERFITSHLWTDPSINRKVRKIILADNQSSFEKFNNIADSLIRLDPSYKKAFQRKFNYWIIQKMSNKVIGPLSEQEYLSLRTQLNVDKNLKLTKN